MRTLSTAIVCTLLCGGAMRGELIGFYDFNGNILDSSGKGNHGTFGAVAPTLTANGYEGQAYQFGGGGLFTTITVPIDINPASMPQVTFGAWVNADETSALIRGLISHDTGGYDRTLDIDTRADGVARWCIFSGSTSGLCTEAVQPGAWTFIAGRYNQATQEVRLTVNGTHYGYTGNLGTGQNFLTIGRNPNFDNPFVGRMDNVFVYNEFLSDAQVNAISGIPEPGTWMLGGAGLVTLGLVRRRRAS